MVATSHPLATRAGLRALERGGNAVDAALAAAAVLTVAEPTDNGIGGDAFALVWDGTARSTGSTARVARRRSWAGGRQPTDGPRSVTVPGAVRLWADLAARFGRFGLDAAVAPAAELAATRARRARRGSPTSGRGAELAPWPAPALGARYRLPELARTLRRIASEGPEALYAGEVGGGDRRGDVALGGAISQRTAPSGSSRCAARTAGSRCASCRRTARARRRSSRWRSTTGSSPASTRRSRR